MIQNTHESVREFGGPAALPSDRSFGLLVGGALAVVATWPWIRHSGVIRYWLLAPALILMLLGLVRPALLRLPNRVWMRFAFLIGRVTNPVVMALLYVLVFTPFAIVLRLLGKDALRRSFDPHADTYWIARTPGPEPSGMRNQF